MTTPHSKSGPSVRGIFAVVLCGCVVVAGSVVFDTPSLLLCSFGGVVGCDSDMASETATEKEKQKRNMID